MYRTRKWLTWLLFLALWLPFYVIPNPHVPSPAPFAFFLLVVFLPGHWLLAKYLTQRAFTSEDRTIIVPGLALMIWILSVHLLGFFSQQFFIPLAAATSLLGVAGYAVRTKTSALPPPPAALCIGTVIGMLLMLPNLVLWEAYDKLSLITGHFSITEQITNNIYPPRHLTFAEMVLPYHYGVDTLFAMVKTVLQLRTDIAVDFTTLVMWGYLLMLFGHLSARLFGPKTAGYAAFIGGFASGLPWLARALNPELAGKAFLLFPLGDNYIQHYVTGYVSVHSFLQHPWTLGAPSFLLLFLMILNVTQQRRVGAAGLLGIFVTTAVLGTAQTALYGTTLAALGGWVICCWIASLTGMLRHRDHPRPVWLADIFIAAMAAAALCFFVSGSTAILTKGLFGTIRYTGGLIGGNWMIALGWNAATFGLTIPLAIAGLLIARQMRLFSILVILIGLTAVNFFYYIHSWDIAKFSVVANLALAIYAAGYTSRLLVYGGLGGKIIGAAAALLLTINSVLYLALAPLGYFYPGHYPDFTALWRQYQYSPPPKDYLQAMAWMKTRIKAGEIVMTPAVMTLYTTVLGGFPVLAGDDLAATFGFAPGDMDRRWNLYQFPQQHQPIEYYREGVRWITSYNEADDKLQEYLTMITQWQAQGLIEPVAEFGKTRIYQFTPRIAQ